MPPEIIPVLIDIGAKLFGGSQANQAAKKAGNVVRDAQGNTAAFWQTWDANVTYYYPQLTAQDKTALEPAAEQLAAALSSNPYVYNGESIVQSRYNNPNAGLSVSNVNVAIAKVIENYLDQKGSGLGASIFAPSAGTPSQVIQTATGAPVLNTNGARIYQDYDTSDSQVKPDYTPWAIGGGVLLIAAILIVRK